MPEVIVVQYNGQFNVGIKNVRNTEYENDLIDLWNAKTHRLLFHYTVITR